ncbi:MAG: LacI family DNA-binding transcriptional regulator, partial [Asticcacaulis sp.]
YLGVVVRALRTRKPAGGGIIANPTIIEVARLAGVSTTTVSRCLNTPEKVGKKTLARVRKVIDDIHFSPNTLAQSFRRGKTNIILVVVHDIGTWLFTEILDGIRSVLSGRYSIILMEARTGLVENNNFIDMLVARQVEGVILLCSPLPFRRKLIETSTARPLPIVIGLEPIEQALAALPSVHIDNHQAGLDATRYLIGLGHRDIVFACGPRNSFVTKDRENGFRAAMHEAGLALNDGSVVYTALSVHGGLNAAHDIFARASLPTAIFCANDDMALGVLNAAARRKIAVPEQLSVMGFDDTCYAATANPPLSTICQPGRDIGVRTAERLLSAIETPGEDSRLTEILPHKLVIRGSTAAAPAG